MAMLQHGCAIVATRGPLTDDMLKQEAGRSFLLTNVTDPNAFTEAVIGLAQNAERRQCLSRYGQALSDREFAWGEIAKTLMAALAEIEDRKA